MTTVFHIRRPLRAARGSQFYRDRSDRGQGTYCGAPETAYDTNSLRDAVPFNGREPCQACKERRSSPLSSALPPAPPPPGTPPASWGEAWGEVSDSIDESWEG